VAGQAAAGSGLGPTAIGYVLGITKAYTTRVGEGRSRPSRTTRSGEFLGTRGHEFGVNTGVSAAAAGSTRCWCARPCAVNGINGIALTKLDVLDGLNEIKVCVGYELDGERSTICRQARARRRGLSRIYETLEGWSGRRRARAAGTNCRRRRSSMCATSKS
jgi:adenylosuccinate synthase